MSWKKFFLALTLLAGFSSFAQFNFKNKKTKENVEATKSTLSVLGFDYGDQFDNLNLTEEQQKQIAELIQTKKATFFDDEKKQLDDSKDNAKKEFDKNKKELKEANFSTVLDFKSKKDKKAKELATKKDSLKTAGDQSKSRLDKKTQLQESIDPELKEILTPEQYTQYRKNLSKNW